MVFHPSHRPLEIATRFPQFHSPDDDDISPTNKKHKGTLLSSYRGGHFYWALTGRAGAPFHILHNALHSGRASLQVSAHFGRSCYVESTKS